MFVAGCLHKAAALEVAARQLCCLQDCTERSPCLGNWRAWSTTHTLHHHRPVCDDKPNQCQTPAWQAGTHLMCTRLQLVFMQKHMLTEVSGGFQPFLPADVGTILCEHLWEQKVNKECSHVLLADVHPPGLSTVNIYSSLRILQCCGSDTLI